MSESANRKARSQRRREIRGRCAGAAAVVLALVAAVARAALACGPAAAHALEAGVSIGAIRVYDDREPCAI